MNLVILFWVYIDVYVWRTRQLFSGWIQQSSCMAFPHLINSALRIECRGGCRLASDFSHQWWFYHWLWCTFTWIITEEDHWLYLKIWSFTFSLWCLSFFVRHNKERFQVSIVRGTTIDVFCRSVALWWYLLYIDALNQIWCCHHSKIVLNLSPPLGNAFVRSCGFSLKQPRMIELWKHRYYIVVIALLHGTLKLSLGRF